MGSGKRAAGYDNRKLNLGKVFLCIVILVVAICAVIFLVKFLKSDKDLPEDQEHVVSITEEDIEEKHYTIEEMVQEFGGEIAEQVNNDTYYINKDGNVYTAYLDDCIVEGRITPWQGGANKPAIDEAGNINIYTAEELKWVADQVISGEKNFSGVTITLRQHIDLGARKSEAGYYEGQKWTPIIGFLDELPNKDNSESTEETIDTDEDADIVNENLKRFAGVFDGNGYTIRGMYIDSEGKRYQGLFGISTGIIHDLTIKNSSITNGDTGIGLIAGLNGGTIQNCFINNVEVKGNSKVGGIAGITMSNSVIENCAIDDLTKITGTNYIGGIVGYANNNSSIKKCENESKISGTDYIGGITGVIFYGSTIQDSINRSNEIIGTNYVGGIAGYSAAQIEKCTNMNLTNGYIKGKNYVGGITGVNYLMGNIDSSINKGKIIVEEENCGGIVGLNNDTISNCYNAGIVDGSFCEGTRIGGICGQNISESYISFSYNIGEIRFKKYADGIAGADFGSIQNSYFLDSSVANQNEKYIKNREELISIVLSEGEDYYKEDSGDINSGFPVLKWEVSE